MTLLRKKIALWAVAGIAALGLIWVLTHLPNRGSVDVQWPAKSHTHTLLLRPATSSESQRLIDYAPDQTTITGMRIEYRDGRTALVSYQNGLPTFVREYYADPAAKDVDPTQLAATLKTLADGLATRQVLSVTELKSDGLTIKTYTTYDSTGNYASIAVRDASGDFVVTSYGANGSANGSSGVAGIAIFDGRNGTLKSRQEFNSDGTLSGTFKVVNPWGSAVQTYFGAAGLKTREILYNSRYSVTIKDYAADGKTVTKSTEFGYSGITVTEYDSASQKPVIERVFSDDGSRISVRYFDDKGTSTMKQLWEKLDTAKVAPERVEGLNEGYTLHEVYEYHNDGYSIKNDITFYPGGKVVREVETRPTTDYRPMKDQFFREDGSLDYTNDCPPSSVSWNCQKTTMPPGANSIRPKVPAGYYKAPTLLPLPSLEKPQVPTMKLIVDLR